ncbi:FTR1 family protein [Thermotoga sp. SG1]|uniref:FTR1 family iron permease n=1 Tax=Thermotoga sp. SG1 TaxID=126739 RepID=UPI000C76BD00|nr:FTR1 family protein [Thermotoga sp. SG1]PLV57322.1 ferrous iron transporter [Thermotoga sp. SG1]
MHPGAFLVTLREALEASVIIAVILAYLKRTGRGSQAKDVWLGTFFSIFASIVLGAIVVWFYGGIEEKELFEGVASYIAVVVLTSMIYWMVTKGRNIKSEIEKKVSKAISRWALIGFAFIVVFREGFETVLFVTPFMTQDLAGTVFGVVLGLINAMAIAFISYVVGLKINLRKFFYYSSILLIFVAAGLAGYGTHEFIEWAEEEGVDLGFFQKEAYNLGITEDNVWHHKGLLGSILAVLFGYSTKMEWGRVFVQFGYLIVALYLILRAYRKEI